MALGRCCRSRCRSRSATYASMQCQSLNRGCPSSLGNMYTCRSMSLRVRSFSRHLPRHGSHTTAHSNRNALGQPLSEGELASLMMFCKPQGSHKSLWRMTCPSDCILDTLAAGASQQHAQRAGRQQLEAALLVAEQAYLGCLDSDAHLQATQDPPAAAAAAAALAPGSAAAGQGSTAAGAGAALPATAGRLPYLDLQALQGAQMLQPVYATSWFFLRRFYVPLPVVEYFDLTRTREGSSHTLTGSSHAQEGSTPGRLRVVTLVGPLVLQFEGSCCWTAPHQLEYTVHSAAACIGGLRLPFPYRLTNTFVFFAVSNKLACSRGHLGGAVLWVVDPPGSQQQLEVTTTRGKM